MILYIILSSIIQIYMIYVHGILHIFISSGQVNNLRWGLRVAVSRRARGQEWSSEIAGTAKEPL